MGTAESPNRERYPAHLGVLADLQLGPRLRTKEKGLRRSFQEVVSRG